MPCGCLCQQESPFDDAPYEFPFTPLAARVAAGCVLRCVEAVCRGRLHNAYALVRPPGHHAMCAFSEGFCYINNAAVAARHAQRALGLRRVMIVDWDVHHGDGTESLFLNDPSVLYLSLHRGDLGKYYPYTGPASQVGAGAGTGFTVNIPFHGHKPIGDAEYAAAFELVVVPITQTFEPELVIVSAGFDAAEGDPLGGYSVTPRGYAHMTRPLMDVAGGRLVVVLEGGYHCPAVASSTAACVRTLLGEPPSLLGASAAGAGGGAGANAIVRPAAVAIRDACVVQSRHWPSVRVPQTLDDVRAAERFFEAAVHRHSSRHAR